MIFRLAKMACSFVIVVLGLCGFVFLVDEFITLSGM